MKTTVIGMANWTYSRTKHISSSLINKNKEYEEIIKIVQRFDEFLINSKYRRRVTQ